MNDRKPHHRAAEAWRAAFVSGITEDDVAAIASALLQKAKKGGLNATRLILDRLLGPDPVSQWHRPWDGTLAGVLED